MTLVWLTLFKLSYDVPTILAEHQTRSINLIPFADLEHAGLSETASNFVIFIPFGLLLSLNFKKTVTWRLIAIVLIFSTAIETLQLVLAIGTTDATDVVTNTIGGFTGLVLYRLLNKVDRDLAVKTFNENIDFYHPICRDIVKKDLGL